VPPPEPDDAAAVVVVFFDELAPEAYPPPEPADELEDELLLLEPHAESARLTIVRKAMIVFMPGG
jgi:hypothetical protein